MDIQNDRYNPKGKLAADDWQFDFLSERLDYVCLFSVFTHMYENEISNYLREIFRTLKHGDRCLHVFLFDEQRLATVTNPEHGLSMPYSLNEHTRYHNPQDKLHAIGFERNHIENLVKDVGFECISTVYGNWAGAGESYQDYLVLEKLR